MILICLLAPPRLVIAQEQIQVISSSVETYFPKGIQFQLNVYSPEHITNITLRYRVVGARYEQYSHFEFLPRQHVEDSLLVRTDTASRYIPPGATIEYSYEISDQAGNVSQTQPVRWAYMDPRFDWHEVKGERASIYYYGLQSEHLAGKLLNAAHKTLGSISSLLGVGLTPNIHMTMYNSFDEMREALPPRSRVQESALIVEGMYFPETNVVLVSADSHRVVGVTAHEIVHFLVDQALEGQRHSVPAWLNEGLAEYANPESSPSFRLALDSAIQNDNVLPLTSLSRPPGKPADVILFYAQSESVVSHLIDTYGRTPFQSLIKSLRMGKGIDAALIAGYNLDRVALDNEWRTTRGLPPATTRPTLRPTAIPLPTIVPYGVPTPIQSTRIPGTREPVPVDSPGSGFCGQSAPSMEIALLLIPLGLVTVSRSLKGARNGKVRIGKP
jgi:hypothetical protein